jgi:adenine-specific DNA-methyltransferase
VPPKRKKGSDKGDVGSHVASIKYAATRKNIPPAGLEAHGEVRDTAAIRYEYNPHLPPVLRSARDPGGTDALPELLSKATRTPLSETEAALLAKALRRHEPWLEWSGKRERPWFEVDPVALHMHERVSTQAILRVLARQDVQRDLFADPQLDYARAVQFYRHDVDWSNRMILGDSLQVMASLARREDLAGKVQMIYVDPPYGIKFSSNFQPQLGQRDVRDRQQDLTREPEMVKAYRDTWTLGVHSYLTYLRDRLAMARDLLADTGSIFVQISDENLHRVRCVMDEVFGVRNFVVTIKFSKTSGLGGQFLDETFDHLIWFAKDKEKVKFRRIFLERITGESGATQYRYSMRPDGGFMESNDDPEGRLFAHGDLTSQTGSETTVFPFQLDDRLIPAPKKGGWKSSVDGIDRLKRANRIIRIGNTPRYVRYFDDARCFPMGSGWTDTGISGFGAEKVYVVQTHPLVVQRCILMTTDPGDLVLDPTCGSGTTAYVAEQWGRRWITIDTSRVALTLAKHRLMTARFDYYRLRELNAEDVSRNPDGTWIEGTDSGGQANGERLTFQCRTVPHITLRSIARNTSLDPIFARHEPILLDALAALNREGARVALDLKQRLVDKLIAKHRREGPTAVSDADVRRWLLPDTPLDWIRPINARRPLRSVTARQVANYREKIPQTKWREWEVPFDADPGWPEPLQQALSSYRAKWRAKMDEVDACIAADAEVEELVDKPEVVRDTVRVAGPFTMEGVIAVEEGPDSPIGGAPQELETFTEDESKDLEVANAEAHLDKIIRLLKASGVDFPGNRNLKFQRLDTTTGVALVHAEGEWADGSDVTGTVAVSVGPEAGNVTAMQVEAVVRQVNRAGYDAVVFAGFGFDAAAQDAIQNAAHPNLHLHMALINPDAAMGDLLKTQPGSQMFSVFSAPRVVGPTRLDDGEYVVEVEGMDVYDPVSNTVHPTEHQRIAAWFLDTDYDGRTFCICQAFFPDRTKWSKLEQALGGRGLVEPGAFDALSGLRSLPFPKPSGSAGVQPWRVAVKVIDPRGNEGLRVLTEDGST